MIIILLKTVVIESCHRCECDLVIGVEMREEPGSEAVYLQLKVRRGEERREEARPLTTGPAGRLTTTTHRRDNKGGSRIENKSLVRPS